MFDDDIKSTIHYQRSTLNLISAVVITNNAKDTIGECLEALLQVTNDVVVVDSGSDDGTKDICLSKQVRYFEKAWEGYSANKNFGNAQAKYDFILSIDSDEILSEELILNIKNLPANTEIWADAYKFRFLTYFCGKWIRFGGWNPEWHVRLFNKTKITWEMQDVHERLNLKPQHHIKKLNGRVLHYSYPTIESHLLKIERYTDLFAERSYKAGKKTNAFKTIASPIFTFLSNYILKLGFLDGYYGVVVAWNNALYSYKKYHKLSKRWETR
jgi:glycosyltransferase involved in cell wall biosynthesis